MNKVDINTLAISKLIGNPITKFPLNKFYDSKVKIYSGRNFIFILLKNIFTISSNICLTCLVIYYYSY